MRRRAPVAALLSLLALCAWVYGAGLDRSPVYLVHDEVVYAINAHAIANTFHDINGQFLPLSFHVTGGFFATPVNIYVTALFLKIFPLTEVTTRAPSVVIGLINIALLFGIARRMFANGWLAVLAAGVYALTPSHFIHSRLGTDHEYAVTAVLAWALCVIGHEVLSTRRLMVAGAILGAGVYTYLGALITMPVCVAITWVVLWRKGERSVTPFAAVAGGFAIVLVPFVAWHVSHPLQYLDQMKMYALRATPSTEPVGLIDRVAAYWNYFNPSFLFFAGDASLINGTRYTGVFLLPLLIFLPIGLIKLFAAMRSPDAMLIALCVLTAPLAAAVVGEPYRINRALVLLPFMAIVAAMGVEVMWARRTAWTRVIVVLLLVLMPVQFAAFYRDYFGDYRLRSAQWLEYNIGGAMEEAIRQPSTGTAPVYIADNIQWAPYYWQFYQAKHGRPDLASVTTFVDVKTIDPATIPPRSIVVCRIKDESALLAAGLTRAAAIPEPDGVPWFSVLRKPF
jgi:hypothetical protein